MLRHLSSRNPELGSVTVLSLAIIAVISMLLIVGSGLAAVTVSRIHAQGAANLAALAAATSWNYVGTAPCPLAAEVAKRNAAELVSCEVFGASVQVEVRIESRIQDIGWAAVAARARAGPAEI